ncbi:MAG: hypothetical protein VW600_21350, partial [Ferrovibrio sp.]
GYSKSPLISAGGGGGDGQAAGSEDCASAATMRMTIRMILSKTLNFFIFFSQLRLLGSSPSFVFMLDKGGT